MANTYHKITVKTSHRTDTHWVKDLGTISDFMRDQYAYADQTRLKPNALEITGKQYTEATGKY